jgi:hypothetical protein
LPLWRIDPSPKVKKSLQGFGFAGIFASFPIYYRTFILRSSQSAPRKPLNLCVLSALPGTNRDLPGKSSRRSGKNGALYGREFS